MSDLSRLMKYVDKSDAGCWLWTGYVQESGYANAWLNGTNINAHRAVYQLVVGPIPEGMQLDHLCRVRHCVNPEHLEPTTPRVNTLRGNTITALNASKTHCPKGHEYDAANTYVSPNGKRHCRACKRDWQNSAKGRAYWNAWYAANRSAS